MWFVSREDSAEMNFIIYFSSFLIDPYLILPPMTGEVTALMECFLKDNLLELRETLWNNKFGVTPEGVSLFGSAFAVTSHDGALMPGGGKLHSCLFFFPF